MRGKRLVLAAVAACILAAVLLAVLTPYPVSALTRLLFQKSPATEPPGFSQMWEAVRVTADAIYPSLHADNTADIYTPKERSGPWPVVLWVHGGAYVGGDKGDVAIYATALASRGYAVVAMNYCRAPEGRYPGPLVQIGEALRWMVDAAGIYGFDMEQVILAGDSAGAHMAAQVAALETSADYAAALGLEPVTEPGSIRAVLLFCGPYDVEQVADIEHPLLRFFMDRAAWAYFGISDWAEVYAEEATVARHVTAGFPPAFISDGNSGSFETQGRVLAAALEGKGVRVETHFIPLEAGTAGHEYQFLLDDPLAQEAFEKAVAFLAEILSSSQAS